MKDPLAETPSQTAGPFLHIAFDPARAGLAPRGDAPPSDLAAPGAKGEAIRIGGSILDGAGAAVTDAVVEVWQADADGIYAHPEDPRSNRADPAFRGFGRASADGGYGTWGISTVRPGRVPGPDGAPMAPHLSLAVFARGINVHLHTRVYLDDEEEANRADPVLASVPAARRGTLVARTVDPGPPRTYRFDIVLQGEGETVFFDA